MSDQVSAEFAEMAQVMKWQLESERLVVGLAPSKCPDGRRFGRMIRVVESRNPAWYRELCEEHSPSGRTRPRSRSKPDTYIKRRRTLEALEELAGGECRTIYAERLLPYVEQEYIAICRRYRVTPQ